VLLIGAQEDIENSKNLYPTLRSLVTEILEFAPSDELSLVLFETIPLDEFKVFVFP